MKPLYTEQEYNNAKGIDFLPLECEYCGKTFYQAKKAIKSYLNGNPRFAIKFCSRSCCGMYSKKEVSLKCNNCGKTFYKKLSQFKKSSNHFCSRSCAATYNHTHKSHGHRRSKLEIWIESQLTSLYPSLDIHFNRKEAINSELDIYIPSLKLAFELNGIFHYEPIYGINKLNQIQTNDISKTKACHNAKIDLCIIDVSQQKYVKPSTSQKYLDIITNIIKERLPTS